MSRQGKSISRRRFVQGLVAGGVLAGFDVWRWPAFAANGISEPVVLTGRHFDLVIDEMPVNFTGRNRVATAINGSIPGPLLRWREGDTVTISVTNRLKVPTSIHWHGVRSPADMDGVPGLSFPGIAAGQTFTYTIPLKQSGTYWYHSHSGFQEQTGHYGALIIDPQDKHLVEYDREYVIVLSDWTDEDPETVLSNLKQQSDFYNFHQPTVGTFMSDAQTKGLSATISDRLRWGRMNMSPADILDVSGATYTYLLNGQAPSANWTGLFRARERIRLRFINASSMTIFDVRIPGLPMTVVQADGNDVEPVTVDEFRISVAETYDVIIQPQDASAFTIFAQSEDRTGYARATLAPRAGMTAPVPPMDPRPMLTMVDMGMAMGNMPGMEMGTGGAEQRNGSTMENMPGMNMGDMPGMKMGTASPASSPTPGMQMNNMPGMKMGDMPGMKAATAPAMRGPFSMPFPQPGLRTSELSAPA